MALKLTPAQINYGEAYSAWPSTSSFSKKVTIRKNVKRFDSLSKNGHACRCSIQEDSPSIEKTQTETNTKPISGPSAKSSLTLLDQYAAASEGFQVPDGKGVTVADQLQNYIKGFEDLEEVTIPLGKKLKPPNLTISQKRNIRRQAYLDVVSKRNDNVFFVSLALFIIVPPVAILGIAVATGYINFFP